MVLSNVFRHAGTYCVLPYAIRLDPPCFYHYAYLVTPLSRMNDAMRPVLSGSMDRRCGNRDYVLKFVLIGDAAVGKSSLLVRLTDSRFLVNPDATVCSRLPCLSNDDLQILLNLFHIFGGVNRPFTSSYPPYYLERFMQLGVEFGSKLIHISDEDKTIKLQCMSTFRFLLAAYRLYRLGHCRN